VTNQPHILRSIATLGVCVLVALFLGFQLSKGFTMESIVAVSAALFVIIIPLLVRWHHVLLVLSLNLNMVVFFLPGRPNLWMVMAILTGLLVLGHRILKPEVRSIRVPSVTWPLLCILAVVIATAQLTGGIGFGALGSEAMGGKRYLILIFSILIYFLITSEPIPAQRVNLYLGLYFLGSLTSLIGDISPLLPTWSRYLLLPFPVYQMTSEVTLGQTRLGGTPAVAFAIFCFMMARYGVRGIFLSGKLLRPIIFVVAVLAGMFAGGFRSMLMAIIMIFGIQFYLEGLHRTRLLPVLLLTGAMVFAACLPFVKHFPFTIQRSLAFLPIEIDPVARHDAEGSSEWRLEMWRETLPLVPSRLLLGQGLAIRSAEFETVQRFGAAGIRSSAHEGSALAGDYHNGPLSVVMPFGIWGVMAFVWFTWAAFKVFLNNYRYGDAALKSVNALLLAWYITNTLMFWFVVGGFYGDMLRYAAVLALSVSINNGVKVPAPTEASARKPVQTGVFARPRLIPSFSNSLRRL
jgi:hypothetical protein